MSDTTEFKDSKTSYDPKAIEQPIYALCKQRGYFEVQGNAHIAKSGKYFSLMMPPPNVTGVLHIGHALTFTLQDIITRFKRMDGFCTLYQPGLDHAGIATQNVVEKQLLAQGLSKETLGREAFIKKVWEWKEQSGGKIIEQMQALGISPAWSRLRFTMDAGLQNAVREAFVAWYERGLIYQGDYMVNWCVKDGALSDIEVEYKEQDTHLYHLRYPVLDSGADSASSIDSGVDSGEVLIVATTRPETLFGDSAVMINPSDSRYAHLLGKSVLLPLVGRAIPIIADSAVDMEFGTGVVKVTPAHDVNDYEVGKRHGLESIVIFDEKGVLNAHALGFSGRDRLEARADIVSALEKAGAIECVEAYSNQVGVCYRCGSMIEPYISRQWFISQDIAKETIRKVNLQAESKKADSAMPESSALHINIHNETTSQAAEFKTKSHGQAESSTPESSEPQAEGFAMRNRGFQARGEGSYLSGSDQASSAESAIYRAKPTPTLAQFHPASWLNNFNAWMRDLRPWCISRQLWWGHRIPVWYCQNLACAHVFASKNERESACPKCGAQVVQDSDVLDTWFSSGLWAFSTLGWGNGGACGAQYDRDDLRHFYPNSLLITGFDILFFWVARMLFSGESLLGELPFEHVYLHALVRDEHGQKMSKSKGNVIDPLAMIEEFGADSLRFALAYSCAQGRDVRLSRAQLELGKNFANKLHNATQFLLLYASQLAESSGECFGGFTQRAALDDYTTPLGRYAKSRLNLATKELRAALESYRFNDGASVAYRFLWGEFCDWCIELAKAQKSAIPELGSVLLDALKLLHPYMPFITDSLYHTLRHTSLESSESIMIAPYPTDTARDETIEQEFALIKDAIISLRRVKALIDMGNRPLEHAYICVDSGGFLDSADSSALESALSPQALAAIAKLAKISRVEVISESQFAKLASSCVADISTHTKSLLSVENIDLSPIIARLESQNLKLEKEIAKLQALESNEKFKANAPKHVLESNAAALESALEQQSKIRQQLRAFGK